MTRRRRRVRKTPDIGELIEDLQERQQDLYKALDARIKELEFTLRRELQQKVRLGSRAVWLALHQVAEAIEEETKP